MGLKLPEEMQFDEAILLQHRGVPWTWTFSFVTLIFFGAVYMTYYHTGVEGRDAASAYVRRDAALTRKLLGSFPVDMPQNRENILQFVGEEKWLNYGESIFRNKCQSCHGAAGGGLVGPNLTDTRWKNVAKLEDIVHILNNGAGNGAMPAWRDQLDPREIVILAAYVASLLGTDPPNAKGPDGANVITSWEQG